MKKTLLAVAVLGAFAGAASAQSSVTLFGVVDLSVNSWKNGATSQTRMDSNQLSSNRFGFRGTEDLGGGLQAGFWLEAGTSSDTGAVGGQNSAAIGSVMFNRRSTVSLISKMGEIRLGQDYTSAFILDATYDVFGANGMGNAANVYAGATLGSGAATVVRANNMVGYFLPGDLGGVNGSIQVAAAENANPSAGVYTVDPKTGVVSQGAASTGVSGGGMVSGSLGYAAGPVSVAVGFNQTKTATNNDFKIVNVGGSYNFGVAKVLGLYDKHTYGSLSYVTKQVSVSVPLGQGEFKAGYLMGNSSVSANSSKTIAGEYIYNLSKRTSLYGQVAEATNKGASANGLGGGLSAADFTAGGKKATGFGLGVRHTF